jgi:predicted nucleic acid-binding protein
MRITVVVDNTALVNFTYLRDFGIFGYLRSIFDRMHIPTEVKAEYEKSLAHEPIREWMLEQMFPDRGFYSLCTKFDMVVHSFVKTIEGIDKGEAEIVAQQKALGARCVLSDDKRFTKAIKTVDPYIKVITTLHVIAMLDMNRLLTNREKLLIQLHTKYPFKAGDLKLAYKDTIWEMGIRMSRKEFDRKISLKALGLS